MAANNLSFKVSENPDWGRYISANKEYAMNDVILDEAPIIIGSLGIKGFNYEEGQYNDTMSVKTCLGCFKLITDNPNPIACRRCGWWVCCVACSDEPFHARYECTVFKNNKIPPSNSVAFGRLNIIRGCIMYKDRQNPQNWEDFTTLSSTLDRQTVHFKRAIGREILKATRWVNDKCKLDVDAAIVGIIVRTFIVNGFAITGQDKDGFTYEAELLYKTGSIFSHSCSPNAEWIVLPTNQNGIQRWNLRIYAMRNIAFNDSINVQYIQDFLNSDTAERQKYMEENYNFFCRCERCMDKTDFNFYTSALRCSVCGNTNVLPDDLSDEISTWTCDVCGECKDSDVMKNYVKDYEDTLHYHIRSHMSASPLQMEEFLEMLIKSANRRNLTDHHRVIIRSMYYWLKLQNFQDLLDFTEESHLKFVKILKRAKKCVEIFRMFGTLRSIVFMELVFAYAIAAFYFKTANMCSIEYHNYFPQEKKQIVSAIYGHLQIALQIMGFNPYSRLYGHLHEVALYRFHFWETTLQDAQEEEDNAIALNESLGNGAMIAFEKVKMHLGKLWAWVWAHLSGEYKPDVSLLSQYNFYSNN